MKELLLSVLAGVIIGIVFKVIRLPLPAPPVLAGVLAVFGVYAGGMIASWLFRI
ncbi:XapX domain-containing protein [Alkalihalobacillus sp. BA299]|uniref:XapX domain-containing protein n=1 Tax=Alkalihalobacillus sp. BA299 TaxID=2815938 RepID=UPI001ADB4DFE|nr:XapX domain-containing protein [Alkalihalobacillus sp. BA299]